MSKLLIVDNAEPQPHIIQQQENFSLATENLEQKLDAQESSAGAGGQSHALLDARFKDGLNHHEEEHTTALMVARNVRKDIELDCLKSQNASYGTVTPQMMEAALNQNDYQLMEEFVAADGNIVNSTYNERSLVEKMVTFYGFHYVKPEALDQFNHFFDVVFNHPNLVMTKDIARFAILVKTAQPGNLDTLEDVLSNKALLDTKVLTESSILCNILNLREISNKPEVITLLKSHGATYGKVTGDVMHKALSSKDFPLFEELLQADPESINAELFGQSLVNAILLQLNQSQQEPEELAQINRYFDIALNHPNLVMTKEIAQSLIKTATIGSCDTLNMLLVNERVMSTDPLSDGSIIENCLVH